MAILGAGAIGIDLGSEYTRVAIPGEGVALREPTRALVSAADAQDVLAVGTDARAMAGRTGEDVRLAEPILCGAVADVELSALLMVALTEKAVGRKKPFEKSALIVNAPTGLTKAERAALSQAVASVGARRTVALSSPVAAALGAGVDLSRPKGMILLSIGGGAIEVAVLSMYATVAARFIRGGSARLDEAITRWYWRNKGIVISQRTAEQLKIEIGTARADADEEEEPVLLKGREAATGKPLSIETNGDDIRKALEEPIREIVDAMRLALYQSPPELAADILDEGILLTGGGTLLHGLAERMTAETGLTAHLSEHPEYDAALGIAMAAPDEALLRALSAAGSLTDV